MPTPGERHALIFIASVAALGVAVRGWREFHPQNPEALAGSRSALARQIQAVDSAIAVTSSKRKARSANPKIDTVRAQPKPRTMRRIVRTEDSAPVDLDTAPLDAIAALPLVGQPMARRIVHDRMANGPFGDLPGLEQVPGITHLYARRLSPYVTFSLSPRLESAGQKAQKGRPKSSRPSGQVFRP